MYSILLLLLLYIIGRYNKLSIYPSCHKKSFDVQLYNNQKYIIIVTIKRNQTHSITTIISFKRCHEKP